MLKRRDAPYLPGRPKGQWWKWKRDPHIIDAVLMYAQRGHGKRSSYYSDYTFGVWTSGEAGEDKLRIGSRKQGGAARVKCDRGGGGRDGCAADRGSARIGSAGPVPVIRETTLIKDVKGNRPHEDLCQDWLLRTRAAAQNNRAGRI